MSGRIDFDRLPDGELPERTRRVVDAALRSIRAVLDGASGGVRLREQFGGIVDCVIDTASYPISIKAGVKSKPLGVLLISATVQRSSTGQAISGAAVTWSWRGGSVLVHAVDVLAASTRYDATLLVME